MKALMLLCAAGVAMLAGCASNPTANQSPAQLLATVHTQVGIACNVAMPTLTTAKSDEAGLPADQAAIIDQIYNDTNTFCALHQSISVTSVTDFANTAIPASLKLVNASSLPQNDKNLIMLGVLSMQTALNAAVAQYAAAQAAVPASGAVAASAPVAASQ